MALRMASWRRPAEVANVGTGRERTLIDPSETRIVAEDRTSLEMRQEVAQRRENREPRGDRSSWQIPAEIVRDSKQTSGYGATGETRENPKAGPMAGQPGTRQAHERPGIGNMRDDSTSSQNAARIAVLDKR
jgi:hypothetical protein